MRIDLSKITLVQFHEFDEFAVVDDTKFTSNRQHTLLYQSRRIIKTSTASSISTSAGPEMSKLTFLNVFDNHRPEEIDKLDRLWIDCKGHLPSRRQLSAIAQSIGIQQSKIKKWFEKRKQEQQNNNNGMTSEIMEADFVNEEEEQQFWNEINAKLDKIDNEIYKIESLM